MMFKDRTEAAHRLSEQLERFREARPLMLGIPRGGVVTASVVAKDLGADLDVVLVRKIGYPENPEFAIGAIDESGRMYLYGDPSASGIGDAYIAAKREEELNVIKNRRALYTPDRSPADPAGRTVIVVDDGIATGSTLISALRAVRESKPRTLVAAVPVAPPDTLSRVWEAADEVECVHLPLDFMAVGRYYEHFPQVSDEEVVALLRGFAS